ncbi:YvrJ family protein [Halalkalibacter krulwichiae]|uniref:YvrJ protein family protein n=1 Tax=Halalkalibacter krulwichiae TaxID=199441 RepID=A0A1X9MGV2_9BACI|nr:YvrJ family protein [Halalkalibacter krulwichiae]ARK32695.1 YvrJ protein family protein [Halalkalibacter krulwichiae]
MDMWLPLLSEFGFPVIVTLYLLHRVENKLDLVNHSILKLPESIHQLQYFHSIDPKIRENVDDKRKTV